MAVSDGPSCILNADTYWLEFYTAGIIDLAEAKRRAEGSLKLKAAYGADPWYSNKARRDPRFWSRFYASRVNS